MSFGRPAFALASGYWVQNFFGVAKLIGRVDCPYGVAECFAGAPKVVRDHGGRSPVHSIIPLEIFADILDSLVNAVEFFEPLFRFVFGHLARAFGARRLRMGASIGFQVLQEIYRTALTIR